MKIHRLWLIILAYLVSAYDSYAQRCEGREPVFFGGEIRCSDAPYKLVFADEFDGNTLDTTKWFTYLPVWPTLNDQSLFARTHDVNTSPQSFKEMQIYRDANVIVSDGTVKLQAKKETGNWFGVTKDYSSGYMEAKTPFRYGKIEVRFKMPKGSGFWPAIWLWGTGEDIAGIRKTQEIDILEYCGEEPSRHHITFHYKNNSANCESIQSPFSYRSVDFADGFHTITCVFNPQFIKVYCDDQLVRYEPVLRSIGGDILNCGEKIAWGSYLFSNYTPTIYQTLILNLAISSPNNSYCNPVDAKTIFPAQMEIDYVRVWQQNIQSGFIDLDDFNSHLQLYPNPASTDFSLAFSENYQQYISVLKIAHSISGQVVVNTQSISPSNHFNCAGWQKGLYVVYMKLIQGQTVSKMILIQ